ncbi:hypothetical protein D3C74_336020 [compost metagenome]
MNNLRFLEGHPKFHSQRGEQLAGPGTCAKDNGIGAHFFPTNVHPGHSRDVVQEHSFAAHQGRAVPDRRP